MQELHNDIVRYHKLTYFHRCLYMSKRIDTPMNDLRQSNVELESVDLVLPKMNLRSACCCVMGDVKQWTNLSGNIVRCKRTEKPSTIAN